MTPRQRKPWSKVVEEAGVSVRIYERAPGSLLYREVRVNGRKDRRSLETRDRKLGEQLVRQLARRLAELQLSGYTGPITLGQLVRLYTEHRLPLLSAGRQTHARQHAAFLLAHLSDGFVVEHLSQTHLDSFADARRRGVLRAKNRPAKEGQPATGVRDGTIRQNLNYLAAVIRWARGFKHGGRRLLSSNPLEGLKLPQEKNVRRPVASEDRYRRTIAKADKADPTGALRCMLALARYTGRRVNAICQLRASDVLLSRDAVLRALAACGQDERLADFMPQGAVRWRAEHDKLGFEELTAIAPPARTALELYLRQHPRLGEAPLFADPRDPEKPMQKMRAEYYLARAEQLAKLEKLQRGLWHPYRRLWAVERKHLPDVDVAKGGGWRDLATMKRSYQQADPATTLRAIVNEAPDEALPESRPNQAVAGHTSDTRREASGGASTL